jgi:hypothetical protein
MRNPSSRATAALLLATSSVAVGCSPGAATNDGPSWQCWSRSSRAYVIDGCYCMQLDADAPPNTDPEVEHCDSSYAADLTLCCRSSSDCICMSVGCKAEPSGQSCWCGFDLGGELVPDDIPVSTCSAASYGRCCANKTYGYCDCDELDILECPPSRGEEAVPDCTAATVPARCPSDYTAVSACDSLQ